MKIKTKQDIVCRDWNGNILDIIPEGTFLTVCGVVSIIDSVPFYYKVEESSLAVYADECEILKDQV